MYKKKKKNFQKNLIKYKKKKKNKIASKFSWLQSRTIYVYMSFRNNCFQRIIILFK